MPRRLKYIFLSIFVLFLCISLLFLNMPYYLKVEQPLSKADAIVVLGGERGERAKEGIRLYNQGFAKRIVFSGGLIGWNITDAEVMKSQAIKSGIPEKAIIIEKDSQSTEENARFVLPILKKAKIKSIILVSSPYHTRRAGMIFNDIFKNQDIRIIIRSVESNEYTIYNPNKWWTRHEDRQYVLSEAAKIIYYKICAIFPNN